MKRRFVRKETSKEDYVKKKESEKNAQLIVEKLLESDISEEFLLNSVKQISVPHFNDIIEERAIMKLCGYPICRKKLKMVMKQTYTINTKLNKVFDITERKHFCSNQCYAAAKFLREQIPTSPLWLRDLEEAPDIELLRSKSLEDSFGEEVDIGDSGITKQELIDEKVSDKELNDSQSNNDRKPCLNLDGKKLDGHKATKNSDKTTGNSEEWDSLNVRTDLVENSLQNICLEQVENKCNKVLKQEKETDPCEMKKKTYCDSKVRDRCKEGSLGNTVTVNFENSENKDTKNYSVQSMYSDNNLQNKNKCVSEFENSKNFEGNVKLIQKIENSVHEWFTSETAELLFGDSPAHKDITELHSYNRLCKLIDGLELDDEQDYPLKPMPDYDELERNVKDLEVKAKAFYSGSLVYSASDQDNLKKQEPAPILPLVDVHAQKALRRRILLDRLNRVLSDLQEALGLASVNISTDVRQLVNTFKLSSHNITFSPAEWNFLALVIINLLSVKNRRLKQLLYSPDVRKHQAMILLSFGQDPNYMDRFIVWLSELDVSNNEMKM